MDSYSNIILGNWIFLNLNVKYLFVMQWNVLIEWSCKKQDKLEVLLKNMVERSIILRELKKTHTVEKVHLQVLYNT